MALSLCVSGSRGTKIDFYWKTLTTGLHWNTQTLTDRPVETVKLMRGTFPRSDFNITHAEAMNKLLNKYI